MWEEIPDALSTDVESARIEIHGGWLVRSVVRNGTIGGGVSVHHVFVPDANHYWKLEKKEEK